MGLNDINSLSHTRWNCKYHIVFAPKYRRKVFYKEKKVYVLNDLYKPYLDELEGWGVIPLKGDLDKLKNED